MERTRGGFLFGTRTGMFVLEETCAVIESKRCMHAVPCPPLKKSEVRLGSGLYCVQEKFAFRWPVLVIGWDGGF